MSIEVIKCPACAATLDCDGKSEFIKCGHCGNILRLKITAKPSEPQEMKYPSITITYTPTSQMTLSQPTVRLNRAETGKRQRAS